MHNSKVILKKEERQYVMIKEIQANYNTMASEMASKIKGIEGAFVKNQLL